jgi:diaminohydroxyphosphoribosylaminopyrimidine deaminase / 5-amino-6-(5-phosphoribosylamino)uracil reductase
MNPNPAAVDRKYIARALNLAARALYTTDPNPRVGCVLTHAGEVVGEGWHERAGEPHAEVMALRAAGSKARGATAYVTLEPCSHTGRTPPCADALIAAGVARVVCSSRDPSPKVCGAGFARLEAAGIIVEVGVLAEEARQLNPGFFSRFERGRPYVRLKMAMTMDARTAPASPGQLWISGEAARADVQTLRARSSAVLTGSGTVRTDDPGLDVRLNYGPWVRQPLRIVLDTTLSCAASAKVFKDQHSLVFTADDARGAPAPGVATPGVGTPRAATGHAKIERVARAPGGLDLDAVLRKLTQMEINELLLECGPTLAGAFVARQLVDEWVLYVAPKFLGDDAAPLLRAKFGAASPAAYEFRDVRRIGDDVRLTLNLKKA